MSFKIFGWDSFGNILDARLWDVSSSGEGKITVMITSRIC